MKRSRRRKARIVFNRAQQAGMSMEEIFWQHVKKTPTHWLWTGRLLPNHYGWFCFEGEKYAAARFSYEFHVGAIPRNHVVRPTCRLRHCVNPAHLECVTVINKQRAGFTLQRIYASAQCCHRGHPWTAANTYIDSRGNRNCRACDALRTRCYRAGRRVPNKFNIRKSLEQAFPPEVRNVA